MAGWPRSWIAHDDLAIRTREAGGQSSKSIPFVALKHVLRSQRLGSEEYRQRTAVWIVFERR